MEIPVSEAIPIIFEKTSPFKNWLKQLKAQHIHVPLQPDTPTISRGKAKTSKSFETEELCYTVAGQKVFFRATIEVFKNQPRRDLKGLETVCKSASHLIEKGFLSRSRDAKESLPGPSL